MVKGKGKKLPTEKWVGKVMKILMDSFGFDQSKSSNHIILVHTNPPNKELNQCKLTLPVSPRSGAIQYVSRIIRDLKECGFDPDHTHINEFEELSIIRYEPIDLKNNRGLRNVSTVTKELIALAEQSQSRLSCKIDVGYKDYFIYLCGEKGMSQGELIEEMMDVYERNQ